MLRKGSNIIMYDDKEGIINGANLIHFKGLTITDSGVTTISDKGYSKITELGVGLFTKKELGKQLDINPLDDIAKGLVNIILTSNAFDNRVEHRYGNTGNLRIIFDKQLVADLKRELYDGNYGEDDIKSDVLVEKVIESVAKRFNTDYVTVHLSDDTSNPSTFIDPRLIEPDTPQQGYLDIYYTVGEPKPKVDVEAVLATLSDRVKNLEDKKVDAKDFSAYQTQTASLIGSKVDAKED